MLRKLRRWLCTTTFLVFALAVAGALSVTPAGAATLTFEGVAPPGNAIGPVTPYTEAGFTLTNLQGGPTDAIFAPGYPSVNTNGTAIFGWCAGCIPGGNVIRLTAVGGVPFSLSTLDAANLEAFVATNQAIVAVGNLVGGGTVTQTLPLTDTWTTFLLSGFTSLASVDFFVGDAATSVPDPAFDNITVDAAPLDSDGDGIPDADDACPNSDLSATVVIDGCNSRVTNTLFSSGCTISDLIIECAEGASDHSQFVSCVDNLTTNLKTAGTITGKQKGAIQHCAAQADIP